MTTKELLNLDYRNKQNKQIIQKALLRIKPLSKFSDEGHVPFEAIEKLLHLIGSKYKVWIKDITLDSQSGDDYDVSRAHIINEDNLETMEVIFGMCMYELFAKVAIFLWSEVKKGKIKRR
jgi:hypothetical protein